MKSKFFLCSAETIPQFRQHGFTDSIDKPVSVKRLKELILAERIISD